MSDSAQFWLTFSGPGTEAGRLDFHDLRASLVALRDLLEEGSRAIVGEHHSVSMKVQANFNTASFEVWFTLSEDSPEKTTKTVPHPEASDTANVLSTIGIGGPEGTGLLWLIKRLKGEVPKKTTETGQADMVELETSDGTVVTHRKVAALLNHLPIRRAVEHLVYPLKQPGITQVRLGQLDEHDQATAITIEKQEMTYFEVPSSP